MTLIIPFFTLQGVLGGENHREVDSEIVNYYLHLAEEGDISATVSLGWIYLHGSERVDQDIPRAMELFRRASEHGHISASGQFGFMLMMEAYRTIQYDNRRLQVLNWLEITGFSSYSSFVSNRQKQNISGLNQFVNLTETYKYALKVARYAHNRGDSTGTFVLGFAQLLGLGLDVHMVSALDLLQSAASRNNADANYVMAEFLMGMRSRSDRSNHFIDDFNYLPGSVYDMHYEDFNENLSRENNLVTEDEKMEFRLAFKNNNNINNFIDFTTASQLYAGDTPFLLAPFLFEMYFLYHSFILPLLLPY